MDGYISGATLCMDTNNNALCDAGEPTTTSDANGAYVFSNIEVNKESVVTLIAVGGTDAVVNTPRSSELKNLLDVTKLDALNITPISDYIAIDFAKATTKDAAAMSASTAKIAAGFGIAAADLAKSPMQDVTIFVVSQELEYMRRILEKVAGKTVDTALQNGIKDAILTQILEVGYQNISIDRIMTILEINLTTFIDADKKAFATAEIAEIKRVFATMLAGDEIQNYTLEVLQKKMESTLAPAIESMTYTAIALTPQDVAYSEYSKVDALYDADACLIGGVYKNSLSDSNATATFSSDAKNGINLNADVESVTISYEDIPGALVGSSVVKFFDDKNYFSFDEAWASSSKNDYIQLPKDSGNKYSCYRASLNSSVVSDITLVKVFR